jgi:hypothetical protein
MLELDRNVLEGGAQPIFLFGPAAFGNGGTKTVRRGVFSPSSFRFSSMSQDMTTTSKVSAGRVKY